MRAEGDWAPPAAAVAATVRATNATSGRRRDTRERTKGEVTSARQESSGRAHSKLLFGYARRKQGRGPQSVPAKARLSLLSEGGHGLGHISGREAVLDVGELVTERGIERAIEGLGEQTLGERVRDWRTGGEPRRIRRRSGGELCIRHDSGRQSDAFRFAGVHVASAEQELARACEPDVTGEEVAHARIGTEA